MLTDLVAFLEDNEMLARYLAQFAVLTALVLGTGSIAAADDIIPNVLGLVPEKAKAVLEAEGYKIEVAKDKAEISYFDPGTIASQSPKGGEKVKKNALVTVSVSDGMWFPNFVARNIDEVGPVLNRLGFSWTSTAITWQAPKGTIVTQSTKSGDLFDSKKPVAFEVSKGPEIIVPDLKNKRYDAAEQQLKGLSLIAKHTSGYFEYTSKQQTNCEWTYTFPVVDSTFPEPGKLAFPNDQIMIVTRKGVEHVLSSPPAGQQCQ
jgi:serine/threonine-protein kinase